MNYPSKLIEEAVNELSKLPGVGKKSAMRFALFLLKKDENTSIALADAVRNLRTKTTYCKICHNIADDSLCNICNNSKRNKTLICVVEDTRDVLAIENTHQYDGTYHVLGGIISPIDGIGPSELKIESLLERVRSGDIVEIILALSSTMEGDTTSFYITKKLKDSPIKISSIARGIPVGGELEFADEITLGRSILKRVDYNN